MLFYYSPDDGERIEGPVSEKDLKRLFESGAIIAATEVCAEGTERWQSLAMAFPHFISTGVKPPRPTKSNRSGISEPTIIESATKSSTTLLENVEVNDNATKIEPTGQVLTEPTRMEPIPSLQSAESVEMIGEGHIIGGYRLLKAMKVTSGEADLYEAQKDGEQFVLKLYRPGVQPKIDIIEKLKKIDRRAVVNILETGEYNKRFYEIQEYLENGSLRLMINPQGTAESRCREILKEVAEAINDLHSLNILHRDIKPENILVRTLNPLDLVLTDFGISSVSELLSLHQTSVSRTAAYAAPEAMTGVISKASDWWSLGVIMVEMLTGGHPFQGVNELQINRELATRGINVPGELSEEWRCLLQGLLTRDPDKRWTGKEIKRWLAGEKDIDLYYTYSMAVRHPYKFMGKEYEDSNKLAVALSQNWHEGFKNLGRGLILPWIKDELKNMEMANHLMDIADDNKLEGDWKLAISILAMNKELPLSWQGEVVNRMWLQSHGHESVRILESSIPEWVHKLRNNAELIDLSRIWAQFKGLVCGDETSFNVDVAQKLIAVEGQKLKNELDNVLTKFKGCRIETIDALFHKDKDLLEIWETIALLCINKDQLVLPEEYSAQLQRIESFLAKGEQVLAKKGVESSLNQDLNQLRDLLNKKTWWNITKANTVLALERPSYGISITSSVIDHVSNKMLDAQFSISPDGEKLAVVSGDELIILNTHTKKEILRIKFKESELPRLRRFIVFTSCGNKIVLCQTFYGLLLLLKVFDLDTNKNKKLFESDHNDFLCSDGKKIIMYSHRSWKITIFDLFTQHSAEWNYANNSHTLVNAATLSPDGKILAIAPFNRSYVELRDVNDPNGRRIKKLRELSFFITKDSKSLSFSSNSSMLATATGKDVCLWDVASGKLLNKLKGHKGKVGCLTFSPNNTLIASSCDKTIRLWDIKDGRQIKIIPYHTDTDPDSRRNYDIPDEQIRFSPDGKYLFSVSKKAIYKWELTSNGTLAEYISTQINQDHINSDENMSAGSIIKKIPIKMREHKFIAILFLLFVWGYSGFYWMLINIFIFAILYYVGTHMD